MSSEKFLIADRYGHVTKNLWSSFKVLADKYAKVNLGQGAPDYQPADSVSASLQSVIEEAANNLEASKAVHQYAPLAGNEELLSSLAKVYSKQFSRHIDPKEGNMSVGIGAQGCLFNAINAFVNPGDEVIIIEPFYDCYPSMVRSVGATPVFVSLRPPMMQSLGDSVDTSESSAGRMIDANHWRWDEDRLLNAFSTRTKLLVLNCPQNPLGKVYSSEELTKLAELCQRFDVVCLSDEVYEWAVLTDSGERQRMANMPGMWDRTLTVGSAGKCFNITGWRVGWCIGPSALVRHVITVHGEAVYSVPGVLQAAVGRLFNAEIQFQECSSISASSVSNLLTLRRHIRQNRDFVAAELADMGLPCVLPSGGWFMLVPVAPRLLPLVQSELGQGTEASDVLVAERLTKDFGLATIPASKFYSNEFQSAIGHGYLRVCLNKKRETLAEGLKLLRIALKAADAAAAAALAKA